MAGKRQENLLAKIANLLEKPVEEIKEARAIYTEEEAALEAQSVLNYYEWRRRLIREKGEPDRVWEARNRVWQYKTCKGCNEKFAYSYHYDGVAYCSLDCLQVALKEIGLKVTYGQPLMKRWGLRYPGIVPSTALKLVESAFSASSEQQPEHEMSSLPKSLEVVPTENLQETSSLQQDMPDERDSLNNTA
jgi:hypothetical protein